VARRVLQLFVFVVMLGTASQSTSSMAYAATSTIQNSRQQAASHQQASGAPLVESQTPTPTKAQIPNSCCGEGCNPNRSSSDYSTSHWDGWKYNGAGQNIGGVYADIWNYSPWVWPAGNSGDYSAAWTMLTTDHPYQTDAGFAQIGWYEKQGGARSTFTQFHEYGGGFRTLLYAPQAVNTYSYYDTFYNPSTNAITFQVNSSGIGETYYPQTFVPGEGQVSGETHTLASQMPGGYSSSYNYEDLFHSSIYVNGAWQAFPNPPNSGGRVTTFRADYYGNDNSGYYGQTTPNNGNISIWDKACKY